MCCQLFFERHILSVELCLCPCLSLSLSLSLPIPSYFNANQSELAIFHEHQSSFVIIL